MFDVYYRKNASKRQMWHIKMPTNKKLLQEFFHVNRVAGAFRVDFMPISPFFFLLLYGLWHSGNVKNIVLMTTFLSWIESQTWNRATEKAKLCTICLSHVPPFTWLLMNWIFVFHSFLVSVLRCFCSLIFFFCPLALLAVSICFSIWFFSLFIHVISRFQLNWLLLDTND